LIGTSIEFFLIGVFHDTSPKPGLRQVNRFGARACVGLRDRGSLFRRLHHACGGEVIGRGETPRSGGDNADADARGFGIDYVLDLVLARDHELPQVAADAHVAVGCARVACSLHGGVGDRLLHAHVEAGEQLLGGDDVAEGKRQACEADTGSFQEITSVHRNAPPLNARNRMFAGASRKDEVLRDFAGRCTNASRVTNGLAERFFLHAMSG
jgi:hypothetical protein